MKKFKKILLMLVVLILPVMFMTACADNDKTARIQLTNSALTISQNYIVGDDVELNGQTFDYYKSIKDDTATESNIMVTKSMISGFSTAKAGDYTFTINYKNAKSEAFSYHVYKKPTLSNFAGKYSTGQLGKKTVVELTLDKVNILTYATISDIVNNTPTKESTDYTIGVTTGGEPVIRFSYDGEKYYFTNFGANGKPEMFGKGSGEFGKSSCYYVEKLEYAKLDTDYTGVVSSTNFKDYNIKVVVGQSDIKITLTNGEDTKNYNYADVDFSINSNIIITAVMGENNVRIIVKDSVSIVVTNSNSLDKNENFRATCSC